MECYAPSHKKDKCYAVSSSLLYYGPQEIRKVTLLTGDLVANKCHAVGRTREAQSPEQNGTRGTGKPRGLQEMLYSKSLGWYGHVCERRGLAACVPLVLDTRQRVFTFTQLQWLWHNDY